MKTISLWALVGLIAIAPKAFANTNRFSEVRLRGEPAGHAYKRFLQRNGSPLEGDDNPVANAKPFDQIDFSRAPQWTPATPDKLVEAFDQIRDTRFLEDPTHANFPRRSSWLYPDDGCFARAALAGQNLAKWGFVRPAKVFIFGNLVVKTPNNPDGSVSWWYHVVPIYMVGSDPVVFDPAIDPTGPLHLKDWVATMTPDITDVKLAVCQPTAYEPNSPCTVTSNSEESALSDQATYLDDEWNRVIELHGDPTRVLGDFPPWKK